MMHTKCMYKVRIALSCGTFVHLEQYGGGFGESVYCNFISHYGFLRTTGKSEDNKYVFHEIPEAASGCSKFGVILSQLRSF